MNDERAIWATPTPLGFNSSACGWVSQELMSQIGD